MNVRFSQSTDLCMCAVQRQLQRLGVFVGGMVIIGLIGMRCACGWSASSARVWVRCMRDFAIGVDAHFPDRHMRDSQIAMVRLELIQYNCISRC